MANAGQLGGVTIATNMAGRGTDIKLTPETKAAGGLCIIGTERHESRRIDNQLRGRSGRQGDPGKSKFFLSLEDDLMRIFGSDRIKGIMMKLGMKDDEPIEHSMITNAIAKAQKKVETHNFDIRKHLLDFDNVMNEQRKVIYKIRRDILNDENNLELIHDFTAEVAYTLAEEFKPEKNASLTQYNWEEINKTVRAIWGTETDIAAGEVSKSTQGDLGEFLRLLGLKQVTDRFSKFDPEQVKFTYREVLLATFDSFWKDHLLAMDHLKEGINLRSYGEKDPLVEYKREAFGIYENMKYEIKRAVVERINHVQLYTQEEIEAFTVSNNVFLKSKCVLTKKLRLQNSKMKKKRLFVLQLK